ncbi:MAG: hypothetical protein A4S09_10940 [Proteobacteria bacterium SG_bin7]|nr:MAG: hypothetical protein A4S09_10940 [Proteobacteria bacterium SG_bin7]
MRAMVINEFGSENVLVSAEIATPEPKKNEVLVRNYACGLNPVDYKIRAGALKDLFAVRFPRILGGDISGVIEAVGAKVKKFKAGDEVFFSSPLNANGGYAEYSVVSENLVAMKPTNISHLEAASLPVAGLTSIQALRDFSSLKYGSKILIHAGAGGVGSFAIQYAKYLGAKVFTTASPKNFDYVKSLGADVIIDYQKENFVDVCENAGRMDVVLESVGEETYLKSVQATREGGVIPSIVDAPNDEVRILSQRKEIKTDFFLLTCRGRDLEEISKLISSKTIVPGHIEPIQFYQIPWAHTQLERKAMRGKFVLEIQVN